MTRGTFYSIPGLANLALQACVRFNCPPHSHDTYAVGLFRGSATIHSAAGSWSVEPGQIVVHHPGEVHWGTTAGACVQDNLYIAPELLCELFGTPGPMRFPRSAIHDPILWSDLQEGLNAAPEERSGKLRGAICRLFLQHGRAPSGACEVVQRPVVADGRTILHRKVTSLSADAGLSRSHFSRSFHNSVGLSPRDFRRQARVQAACEMIVGGGGLAQSAADAGFADQAHMTRQFRSILGVTPGAVKQRRP